MSSVKPIAGGVTAPAGFRASGLHCGIKASGKPDLSLIVSDVPASAAGIFTINLAKAAPLYVCEDHLASSGGHARAVITNSGCANACTGPQGMADAQEMAQLTATAVGCPLNEVLVASTGVIGVNLKMDKIRAGVPQAVAALATDGGAAAARAIMTTDPFPKEFAVEVTTEFGKFHVGGMAKGSGMIEPRMATMLGYLTTDAIVDPVLLSRALTEASRYTFNAITVDGEPSTNDCVFALANGASGVEINENLYPALFEGLRAVAHELALGIVRGGEGATKLISITVSGAATDSDAWMAARAIANSPLVKTAVHGGDPNWGRLVAAAGRSGAAFVLDGARVQIGPLVLFENGRPFDDLAPKAAEYLTGKDLQIEVNLGAGGTHRATVWTCDLSAEYVKINAEYRT
ncbi:MAG TPA: bifunctional glutamate N-acetyltransferase/amino-acid acetyltransferase ArgJ [Vicinamibacterales bacterium]|nr:bifunctional glutamate N-acetyltransferase/amino-acid acetyltransferase ArgJ [Vicinamibacterales bacterium]